VKNDSSHLPAYEDGTECSETSAYKILTPGNYPEESIQHSEPGGSLKSRVWSDSYCWPQNKFASNRFGPSANKSEVTHQFCKVRPVYKLNISTVPNDQAQVFKTAV
jgi:hypothetical protein